ncbi:MAG TPA: T9SS type A sorting domain-containing protein, partial [Bacteroidales bacterium]|nr:T9SS type A sorting domain-containing protein [Bacteroidales bacterium]
SDLSGTGKKIRITHSSMDVVIAANMDVSGATMAPGFPHAGTWYDYFTGQTVNVTDPSGQVFSFGPGDFRVFTSVALPRPFYSVGITVKDSVTGALLPGANVALTGSGSQYSDVQGKADFTASAGTPKLTVSKNQYKTRVRSLAVSGDLALEILLVPAPNGTDEPGAGNRLKLYPNPAGREVTIESEVPFNLGFFTPDGRPVLTRRITGKVERINLTGLEPGLYILRFSNDRSLITRKLLVGGR